MLRIVLPIVVALVIVAEAQSDDVIDVGTVKQLLVDDYVVEQLSEVNRVVQQPQRVSDEPILVPEHPWEGSLLQMPCVLWDPQQGIFHMYYWAHTQNEIFTCYARSADGFQWEKPKLNLHVGPDGSKENNIVLRGEGKQARTRYVIFNPRRDQPHRRFLALYVDNVPGLTEFTASSADGLNWTTENKIGDLRHVRDGTVTANPPFFLIEQNWAKDPIDGHRYRAIWRTESQDMTSWSGGQMVVERLADDDVDLEFYHASSHFRGSQTYCGVHLGYLYLYHTETARGVRTDGVRLAGTIDTALMVSRDTLSWTRVDRSRRFFPLSPEGSWDGQMNFVSPEVIVDDSIRFYYSGWKYGHGADRNEAAIGLAKLPIDRFVAIEPTQQRGWLTTKPFVVKGEQLIVNTDATDGELRVEVLSEDRAPIQGYDAADCEPIATDELRAPVRWSDRSMKQLQGKTIRLRFQLDGAKLFAFVLRNGS